MIPTVDPIISMERDSYNNRSYPQHERNNRSTAQHREQHHTQGYYLPRFQQNGGNMHHYPHHVVHTQIPPGAHFHQQDGGHTNTYGCYQSYGAAGSHHLSGSWAPQGDQNVGRGYGRPQQSGNQFSTLNRGARSKRPPPSSGYGR
ncbi:hypothetical protein CsSME_00048389 [Camellia sinensis var. sinensis]